MIYNSGSIYYQIDIWPIGLNFEDLLYLAGTQSANYSYLGASVNATLITFYLDNYTYSFQVAGNLSSPLPI